MLAISKFTQKRFPGRGIKSSTQEIWRVKPKNINSTDKDRECTVLALLVIPDQLEHLIQE